MHSRTDSLESSPLQFLFTFRSLLILKLSLSDGLLATHDRRINSGSFLRQILLVEDLQEVATTLFPSQAICCSGWVSGTLSQALLGLR
jgi:hypothetical protein